MRPWWTWAPFFALCVALCVFSLCAAIGVSGIGWKLLAIVSAATYALYARSIWRSR